MNDLPHDSSALGMPARWFWFEVALQCAIDRQIAHDLLNTTRDDVVSRVGTIAYFHLDTEADRAWLRFREAQA